MMDKRLLKLVPEALRHVLLNVFWQWLGLLANVGIVWQTATVLQAVTLGRGIAWQQVLTLCASGALLRLVATREAQRESFRASQDVRRILRQRIFEKALALGPRYAEQVPTAEVMQLAVEGTEQLETYFGQYLPQLFYSVLAPLTLFVALLPISMRAALVLLVFVPLIPVVIVIIQKIAKRILGAYWDEYASLADNFLENLQGLSTLKIYQADAARHERMDGEAEHFRVVTMKVLTMQLNSIIVMDIVALGGAAAGIAVALFQQADLRLTCFGCLLVVLLSADFFIPMRRLGSYFHVAMNGMAAADKIFRLLALEEPEERHLGISAGDHLSLQHLSFSYDGEREVLSDVTLDVPAVGLTALVGESGSGKSTVARLLAGGEDGYEGNLFLGGKQLRDINRAQLARFVTTVPSGSHLFSGSVRDNLLLAAPDATDEALWQALDQAALGAYLRTQEGLDTPVGNEGERLSGGQRQRLALARALLSDARVFIFDEATSNIDVESEEAVMAAVHELARSRAVVVISHRLANVSGASCIYVLERGRVVGGGTHAQLLGSCEAYRALWEAQQELERYGGARQNMVPELQRVAQKGGLGVEDAPVPQAAPRPTSNRSSLQVMWRMLGLVRPLAGWMLLAILCGVAGFACATAIPTLGAGAAWLIATAGGDALPLGRWAALLGVLAVARGVLHYVEQRTNHYIAFRLLAHIRSLVFGALRRLAPAKLAGADRGSLISTLTSDIELLEVFFAHTISPVAIAAIMSCLMVGFLRGAHPQLAAVGAAAYVTIGVVVPLVSSHLTRSLGGEVRAGAADLSSLVLDGLRGLAELIQFDAGGRLLERLDVRSRELQESQRRLSDASGIATAIVGALITLFSLAELWLGVRLLEAGQVDSLDVVLCCVGLLSSFGPVVALANLGTGLSATLASGTRVLDVLDETPQVEEASEGLEVGFEGAQAQGVGFSYVGADGSREQVLSDVSLTVPKGAIVGISGKSGSGKSTLLRLLMRFWDVDEGAVCISGQDVRTLSTSCLRSLEALVEQDTYLFHDSIRDNLLVAKPDATQAELEEACRAASVYDFVMSLPHGFDSMVGELGDTLSGGERQRLGLARAFLHGAPLLLLDEPTSNLDALNEGVILKSLDAQRGSRTVLLVSHRASTMGIADEVYAMDAGRVS